MSLESCCQHSSAFLDLPRELRNIIYLNLLHQHQLPPEDPDQASSRLQHGTTFYEARSPRPILLQMKLVCRLLCAEVDDVIQKKVPHSHGHASMDLMVKGPSIWPTWTFLPLTSTFPSTIRIRLRLFEAKGWGSEFSTGAYRSLWSLFNLLVFRGPCFVHNTHGLLTPLQIDRLVFDIRLCFPTSVDDLFETYRDVFDRIEKLASDNVGLGNVERIEACLGTDVRVWRLKQLPTGLTFASRV